MATTPSLTGALETMSQNKPANGSSWLPKVFIIQLTNAVCMIHLGTKHSSIELLSRDLMDVVYPNLSSVALRKSFRVFSAFSLIFKGRVIYLLLGTL